MHPTSLPSETGVGTLGVQLRRFLEFLRDAQLPFWQTLPLGPTSYGDSPYSALSIHAGNPYLIDLDDLVQHGLLGSSDLEAVSTLPHDRVDYGGLYHCKWPLLRLAHKRFQDSGRAYLPNYGLFSEFQETHQDWLPDYATYMAFKDHFNGSPWTEWPAEYRDPDSARKSKLHEDLAPDRSLYTFTQYLFEAQWTRIRDYAQELGLQIMGDIPIFVSLDSVDVWANRDLFKLDETGQPTVVAGVPPDYFSETGQMWGNPVFDWPVHKTSRYDWWLQRLERSFQFYDLVRLDHFRGFADYWEIPAGSPDAREGTWAEGPGVDFFRAVKKRFPEARLVAEDLGVIDDRVRNLLRDSGLPGMAVLHFAFDGEPDNEFLPCNVSADRLIYTGTHDNDTTLGWYESVDERIRDQVRRYFSISGDDISWDFIRAAYRSQCHTCVFPVQELFALGTQARMNYPGTPQGNWAWRMTHTQFESLWRHVDYFRELAWLYNRLPTSSAIKKD